MAKYRKLGRTSDQRKALLRNQVTQLIYKGKIVTTEAKAKDIKVVAEGVETLDELNMVIGLGADLIQGYYTAKPAPEPIKTIPEEIKKQIINAYKNSLENNVEELL